MESYQKGTTRYLQIYLEDNNGAPIHGALVKANLYRNDNNYYFNPLTNTFGLTGSKDLTMFEFGTTGIYRWSFDQSLDAGGVQRDYTVVYNVTSPFVGSSIDTLHYFDVDNSEVKGVGWENASRQPSLMRLANKDTMYTYEESTDSLEEISGKVDDIIVNTSLQITGL